MQSKVISVDLKAGMPCFGEDSRHELKEMGVGTTQATRKVYGVYFWVL
jgi:hypothetical protein